MPCAGDFEYRHSEEEQDGLISLTRLQKLKKVVTWQQLFQIVVASVSFVAGAGVGREILHEPLATAEGVLNYPIIVSQFAVIFTEVHLLGKSARKSSISLDVDVCQACDDFFDNYEGSI